MIDPLSTPAAITFDCYGTLVDWETGILDALEPLVRRSGRRVDPAWLLGRYAEHEASIEAGPFLPYRAVLDGVTEALAADLAVSLLPGEAVLLSESLPGWPVFPDAIECLPRLAERCPLGVLSNVDDALFAATLPSLGVEFRWVVTAERVGAYKPSERNFRALLEVTGLEAARILHVAQSRFHDVAPASALGFRTVWVNRDSLRAGGGATPDSEAAADLTVANLRRLERLLP
jgi:2-haloacid dehalogenase